MAARKPKSALEDGHDAIVRRLLASQAKPVAAAPAEAVPTRSPADLLVAARRFSADVLPALKHFSGPALVWDVKGVRAGSWDEATGLALATALTRENDADPELAALMACDGAFLSALMASLFGLLSERRSDPTASELSVFAQLAVCLRDAIDPALAHAPPDAPADCMRLYAPSDANPHIVDIDAVFGDTEGRLALAMTQAVASRFLPETASEPRSTGGMNRLPLSGTFVLAGPRLRLEEVAGLAIGSMLTVTDSLRLTIDGRSVAQGRLDRSGDARSAVLQTFQSRGPTRWLKLPPRRPRAARPTSPPSLQRHGPMDRLRTR